MIIWLVVLVSWDYYSQYMEIKKNCPNHQPDDVDLPHAALEHVLFQHLTAENPRILMENPWGQMSALHLSLAA